MMRSVRIRRKNDQPSKLAIAVFDDDEKLPRRRRRRVLWNPADAGQLQTVYQPRTRRTRRHLLGGRPRVLAAWFSV